MNTGNNYRLLPRPTILVIGKSKRVKTAEHLSSLVSPFYYYKIKSYLLRLYIAPELTHLSIFQRRSVLSTYLKQIIAGTEISLVT